MYDDLVKQIEQLLKKKQPVIVAICGYGGSGKTFLSDRIAKHFVITERQILHIDFLHTKPELPDNPKDVFSGHDWPKIYKILREVKIGKRLQYKSMGLWGHSHSFDEAMPNVLIIEGVRLLRKEILPLVDIAVWIDAPVKYVTERAKTRDRAMGQNEEHIKLWDEDWVPRNDRYVEEINPKGLATFIFTEYK